MNTGTPNILLIRFSSIGDILLTTPFIRQIRTKFPAAHIRFITKDKFTALVQYNPMLDEVIGFDDSSGVKGIRQIASGLSSVNFDYVFDLHNNQRSHLLTRLIKRRHLSRLKKHRIRRAAYVYAKRPTTLRSVALRYMDTGAIAEIPDNGEGLELFIPEDISHSIKKQWRQPAGSPYICLAPGAGFATKMWPAAYWTKLAQNILDKSTLKLIIVGGPADHKLINLNGPRVLNLAGKLSLLESAAIIKSSQGIICNDSGLMHMAAAMATPITAIFGGTTPELGFAPFRTKAAIVQAPELWCRPCSHMGRKGCPLGHFKCMRQVRVDKVLQAADFLLHDTEKPPGKR